MALTLVQTVSASSNTGVGSLTATLSSVAAGDVIVAILVLRTTEPTWSFSGSDSASNTYTQIASVLGGQGAQDIYGYTATAGANASNLAVNVTPGAGESVFGLWAVYQLRGATAPTAAACVTQSWTTLQTAGTSAVTPAFALANGGIAVLGAGVYINSESPTFAPITPSAGTYTAGPTFVPNTSSQLYAGSVSGAGAQSAETVTFTPNPTSQQWRASVMAIAVAPSGGGGGNAATVASAITLGTLAAGTQGQALAAQSGLRLGTAASLGQRQALAGTARLGPLASRITVSQGSNVQAATLLSRIGPLAARGNVSQHGTLAGRSVLGPLAARIGAQATQHLSIASSLKLGTKITAGMVQVYTGTVTVTDSTTPTPQVAHSVYSITINIGGITGGMPHYGILSIPLKLGTVYNGSVVVTDSTTPVPQVAESEYSIGIEG